jgi:hypothetical protein
MRAGRSEHRVRGFLQVVAGLSLSTVLVAQPPVVPDEPPPVLRFGPEGLENGTEKAPPATLPAKTEDASTPAFRKALDLQKAGKWKAAEKAFRDILEAWPSSVHADAIELRAGDNAYLGCETLWKSGPSERRIDVVVMGDGFTLDTPDQQLQEKWAKLCLDVLWNEHVFDEYKSYFNWYFCRLASLEEGVDPNLSPEERARIIERNKSRTRKKKLDYSTALDCKAAGPQGQVMADPKLVRKWMKVADEDVPGANDDRLTIAFARFGVLGMGGGGIANVGRPDKSVTVHEFGHAFVGLLDEYANNPGPPERPIRGAANASSTDDPTKVPWAHFLAKKVAGVGVFEGGATYRKGVWRPARACAMNSAGNNAFCPVCREAGILRIYRYVSPIDAVSPATRLEVRVTEGKPDVLTVVPMRPKTKALEAQWFVESVGPEVVAPADAADATPTDEEDDGYDRPSERLERLLEFRGLGGRRGREDRAALATPPPGQASAVGLVKKVEGGIEHQFPIGRLKPGRYRITAEIRDATPFVLKDDQSLLKERATWIVTVNPR